MWPQVRYVIDFYNAAPLPDMPVAMHLDARPALDSVGGTGRQAPHAVEVHDKWPLDRACGQRLQAGRRGCYPHVDLLLELSV